MVRNLWTKEEMMLAFNLYLKLPFGKMHQNNPDIIALANIIGRTPGSVAIRLTNFASIDPYHQKRGVKGMTGGSKQCQPIWNEFINNKEDLFFESERILAERENQTIEKKITKLFPEINDLKGETKVRELKTRVNQNVFRQIIVSIYNEKCAISGINIPDLLVASHIIPWSVNEKERLNPENGICLSSLYDSAFDKGLIGITTDYKVVISNDLKKQDKHDYYNRFFAVYESKKIAVPERFLPKKEFLEYHMDTIFSKHCLVQK